jgi:hypothetical protein
VVSERRRTPKGRSLLRRCKREGAVQVFTQALPALE